MQRPWVSDDPDIMTALNPFEGEFYRKTLQMSRLTP